MTGAVVGDGQARGRRIAAGAVLLCLLALGAVSVAAGDGQALARGEYLFRLAGCAGCHTDVDNDGPPLAGGRAIETPFGTFYSPNITPDPKHGIGAWSETDFIRALTLGEAPDGRHYYPAFPYTAYTRMHAADLRDMWAYLSAVEPSVRSNRAHRLVWYLRSRLAARLWKLMHFSPGAMTPRTDQSPEWNRGAYLAGAVAHCGECHTPRDRLGAPFDGMAYAGARKGPEGEAMPNITPDRATGIGRWSEDDLAYFLESGATRGGDYTGSLMAEVIDNGLRYLTSEDRKALVTYLRSLPPIFNQVRKPKADKARGADDEY